MNLINKYKPELVSELEHDYKNLENCIKNQKTFIVNGPKNSGKSTIVKLYLKNLNYDYLLLDDPSLSREYIIEKIKYRTNSVFSYFYNKEFVIVIDNFDLFDSTTKEYIINNCKISFYILISNKFMSLQFNFIKIRTYSHDYLMNLYLVIYYLEKDKHCNSIPEIDNINQLFSILEFNISTENNSLEQNKSEKGSLSNQNSLEKDLQDYRIFFDKFNYSYNDLITEKDYSKKMYILDRIDNYATYHSNMIYNTKSIDDLSDMYNTLCDSSVFVKDNNTSINFCDYYSYMSLIGTSIKLESFEVVKENVFTKKRKKFNYIR